MWIFFISSEVKCDKKPMVFVLHCLFRILWFDFKIILELKVEEIIKFENPFQPHILKYFISSFISLIPMFTNSHVALPWHRR